MKSVHFGWLVGLLYASCASAQTVIVNNNIGLQSPNVSPFANVSLGVWQDAAATNPTAVSLNYDGTHITYVNADLDEAADLYLVHLGDYFDPMTIHSNSFPTIVAFAQPISPVTVGPTDFYLGVSTGIGFDNIPGGISPHRTAFGWVHLQPASPGSTTLVMLGNAMSYDSPGIIVGTTTLVPEPTAAALLALAGLVGTIGGRVRRVHR